MTCRHGCCPTNRDHWLTVAVAPSATPTRTGGDTVAQINRREANWDRDMPAYKRLRRNGLQPKSIDGCAELESKAVSRFEIEMGHLIPPEDHARAQDGIDMAKELVWEATG